MLWIYLKTKKLFLRIINFFFKKKNNLKIISIFSNYILKYAIKIHNSKISNQIIINIIL